MSRDLKEQTKQFSISIINLAEEMKYSVSKKIIRNQIVRSGILVWEK